MRAMKWLAIAVATLWAVSVGGEVDANLPVSSETTSWQPAMRWEPGIM